MNETNERSELETQLLSWTPRRPSPGLERRLFAEAPASSETLAPFRFSWLAPVTGALALMCVLFSQRYAASLPGSDGGAPMVAMILSNQSVAAYLPGSFRAVQNNLPADAFKYVACNTPGRRVAPLSLTNRSKQP
jgi:hypothetical protein